MCLMWHFAKFAVNVPSCRCYDQVSFVKNWLTADSKSPLLTDICPLAPLDNIELPKILQLIDDLPVSVREDGIFIEPVICALYSLILNDEPSEMALEIVVVSDGMRQDGLWEWHSPVAGEGELCWRCLCHPLPQGGLS